MSTARAPEARAIRTRPAPECLACGSPGATLYHDLEDRLFGAPGRWRFARCGRESCGLLWLDPAPLPEDLGLAYASYYTHGSLERRRGALAGRARRWAIQGFLSHHYGYAVRGRWAKQVLARVFLRTPELREYFERMALLQPPLPGGRALDVGCGEGRTVELLGSLGWRAEGVDFDAAAVARARAKGLTVALGTLADQRYPDARFDVVGMSHVLEHVPDPVATLQECRRVLRPGACLVLATPNALALGHRRFGPDWRGLEPPRHLQVFTPEALRALAARAGLEEVSLSAPTLGAAFAHTDSRRVAGDATARYGDEAARAFAREEAGAARTDRWAGEELLLVARPA